MTSVKWWGRKKEKPNSEEEQPAYLNNETSKVMWCFPTGLSGRCFIASSINHTGKWCHYYIVGSLAARIRFSQIYLWDNIFEKHKTIGHVTWLTFNNKSKTRVASSFSLIIYYSLSRLTTDLWLVKKYIFIYILHIMFNSPEQKPLITWRIDCRLVNLSVTLTNSIAVMICENCYVFEK